jgi:hypothetical protein
MTYNDIFPTVISFWDPSNPTTKATTDFVSVRGDLWGSNAFSVTLQAFDVNGLLIGSDTEWDQSGPTLSIGVPGIHYVRFLGTPYSTHPNRDGVALDDLRFNLPISTDADGDGVPNETDECTGSVLTTTVVIGECDSGVTNTVFPSGCSISDDIKLCASGAKNHGEFVSCVTQYLNDLRKPGVITGRQKGAIQGCSASGGTP